MKEVQDRLIYLSEVVTLGDIPAVVVGFWHNISDASLHDIQKSVGDKYNVTKIVSENKSAVIITKK